MLRALGWTVDTVYEHPPLATEKDDSRILAWAHSHQMVMITFDSLGGEAYLRVTRELQRNGGKLIQIGGGPNQPPMRAVGKLLYHHDKWYSFFNEHDGRVNIHDLQRYKEIDRANLTSDIATLEDEQFEQYLEKKREERRRPRKTRQRRIPPEQKTLGNSA